MLKSLRERLNSLILGKSEVIDLALTTLLGGGHLLLEDVPGVGKTTLARELAGSSRVNINVFNSRVTCCQWMSSVFRYIKNRWSNLTTPGPIFALYWQMRSIGLPQDPIMSAQAMNEREISVDRSTHTLPTPFMVIATQNPRSFEGIRMQSVRPVHDGD